MAGTSDAVTLAMVASLPPTLAIVFAFILQWRAGKKAAAKLEEVHGLVNSRLSAALEEIRLLREMMDLKSKAPKEGP